MALPPIEERFKMLVEMVQRDLGTMQAHVNALVSRVTVLEQQLARAGGKPQQAMNGAPEDDASTIVGTHPVTGRPVTAKQLKEDPKLRLRMQFAESDA